MGILKKIKILFCVLVLAYFLAGQFGNFYIYFFPQPIGHGSLFSAPISESSDNILIGLPIAYIFFIFLLFTAFGGKQKYWWIGILLIPAVVFELYFDANHIYFPIALGVAGWLLGLLVAKTLSQQFNKLLGN